MRTAIESLTEDEFLRDLVRFPFQSPFADLFVYRNVVLSAFTDMLIFLLKLPLVFKSPLREQIAHLQTMPEKAKLVPPGSCE